MGLLSGFPVPIRLLCCNPKGKLVSIRMSLLRQDWIITDREFF
jgi:hypothetical protein